jgi:predicted ATPase/class 3 adenylate cyclase
MQNLVPHFILEKDSSAEDRGQLDAAALFADISGFSTVTHTLSQHGSEAAEVMADIMCRIFEPLVDAVYAAGGFISGFAGDAFTALFPAGPDGLDLLRALSAARAIQSQINANPVQETAYGRFPFAIKLGLAAGRVDWGILRPVEQDGLAAYYFSGPAIDAASGAEHHAAPGNLILAPDVAAALAASIRALPVGDQGYVRLLNLAPGVELPAPQALTDVNLGEEKNPPLPILRFTPRILLEQTNRVGEFRQVVTVFINLMGVQSHADLQLFVQSVFALQRQYGGHLARVDFGDKGCNLLLFWGAPASSEDDIERALNFTLALGEYTPASYKAGLTFCPMYAGLAGSQRRGEFTCYGDGINLAARLMMAAPWGSLWLDERLARRAGGQFVTEKAGEQIFKGFDAPQPVYALLEKQTPQAKDFFKGKLVGHAVELARLEEFTRPLLAGERRFAGILCVEGEAGLGKSRLVAEFLQRITAPGPQGLCKIQWAVCQTEPTLRAPFNAWRYWLRNYFEQSLAESSARNKRAFGRGLDQLIATTPDEALRAELNRGRSFLGALLDLYWDNSPYAGLEAKGRYELTLAALVALVRAESLRCPLVINLEDVQWLDDDSLTVVTCLTRVAADVPFAILATARPVVGDKPLFGEAPYQRLELGLLKKEELETLAGDVLGAPIDAGLADLLEKQAEGNPFFAEQILLFLRDQGRLIEKDGHWQLAQAAGVDTLLPSDVRMIFTSRLDSLSSEVREVVQTAAILGREFEVRVLADMLRQSAEGRLPDWLEQAESSAIWSALSEIRYIFKHALLRDAAYEMQLRARRRELHRLAAEALEKLYANDIAPHAAEIAYHYQAACRQGLAGVRLLALDYLEQAGQRAARGYENTAAIQFFSGALELLAAGEDERRWNLLLQRETVYDLTAARAAQSADLDALAALAEASRRPAQRAEVALRRARYAEGISDFSQAIAQAQAAAGLAQAAGRVDLEAKARSRWGSVLCSIADLPGATEQEQQALVLARAAGQTTTEAQVMALLGEVSTRLGNHSAGREYYEQALALYQASGDRVGEGWMFMYLSVLAIQVGDYAAVQSCCEQGLAACRATGDRANEGGMSLSLGATYLLQGNLVAARRYLEQGLAAFRFTGTRRAESIALRLMSEYFLSFGDFSGAQGWVEQTLTIARSVGDRNTELLALIDQAYLDGALGHLDQAFETIRQALAISQQTGERILEISVHDFIGQVYLHLHEASQAREQFANARALAEELGYPAALAKALGGLALAAVQLGDTAQARAALDQALPILAKNPTLDGVTTPFEALCQIGQSLLALGDARGAEIITDAYRRLQDRADKIADETMRRSYLENVPMNQKLCAAYAQLQGEAPAAATPLSPQPGTVPPSPEAPPPPVIPLSPEVPQPAAVPPSPEPPAATRQAAEPANLPADSMPASSPAPVISGADKQALVAQIAALLGQAGQGVTLIVLGDIHIHVDQIVLDEAGKKAKG